jgi:hypothetical protein
MRADRGRRHRRAGVSLLSGAHSEGREGHPGVALAADVPLIVSTVLAAGTGVSLAAAALVLLIIAASKAHDGGSRGTGLRVGVCNDANHAADGPRQARIADEASSRDLRQLVPSSIRQTAPRKLQPLAMDAERSHP